MNSGFLKNIIWAHPGSLVSELEKCTHPAHQKPLGLDISVIWVHPKEVWVHCMLSDNSMPSKRA